ncbi:MAG: hypothetical protein AAF720_04510 [Pseudomonadota bacterium]
MLTKSIISVLPNTIANPSEDKTAARDKLMRDKANEFEAVFIGQFLKNAGLEKAFGEEAGHFGQFLIEEFSERIAESGGFGVADQVYEQLKRQDLNSVEATVSESDEEK